MTSYYAIDANGKIIELGVTDRCFTSQQRRATTLRDGGCILPGCQSPAAWAEIHLEQRPEQQRHRRTGQDGKADWADWAGCTG